MTAKVCMKVYIDNMRLRLVGLIAPLQQNGPYWLVLEFDKQNEQRSLNSYSHVLSQSLILAIKTSFLMLIRR